MCVGFVIPGVIQMFFPEVLFVFLYFFVDVFVYLWKPGILVVLLSDVVSVVY